MTYRQTALGRTTGTAERARKDSEIADGLHETLREQICRRLPGGARRLGVELDYDSATVVLTGVVASFYAKQVLYQLCRRYTPGFRVIDTTVVGDHPKARAQ